MGQRPGFSIVCKHWWSPFCMDGLGYRKLSGLARHKSVLLNLQYVAFSNPFYKDLYVYFFCLGGTIDRESVIRVIWSSMSHVSALNNKLMGFLSAVSVACTFCPPRIAKLTALWEVAIKKGQGRTVTTWFDRLHVPLCSKIIKCATRTM